MDDVRPLGSPTFANPPRADRRQLKRPRGVPRTMRHLRHRKDDAEEAPRPARKREREDRREQEDSRDQEGGEVPAGHDEE